MKIREAWSFRYVKPDGTTEWWHCPIDTGRTPEGEQIATNMFREWAVKNKISWISIDRCIY